MRTEIIDKEKLGAKMRREEYGGYISKLRFNNELEVDINKNDIVIFVGPNNAGKSQALRDIYELSDTKKSTKVVSDIEIIKYDGNPVELLEEISKVTDNNVTNKNYAGVGYNIKSFQMADFKKENAYGAFRPVFLSYLDTYNRLSICNPPQAITRNAVKNNPIYYAAFESKYRKWISESFKKAFGKEIIPNIFNGATIPLCIGEPVSLDGDYKDDQERLEVYAELLDKFPRVQDQGDGVKSFTGILLYLMMDYYCTFLIDEPDSFLHPPQANIMGRIIGQTLSDNQQAFISTHSEEILKGITEVCPERVKIIRITRDNNTNNFSVLENGNIKEIWSNPLLKHSNIMSGLFHNEVIVCESDADCKMYSTINSFNKQMEGRYAEQLFVHSSGKHRMIKIVKAMHALGVKVKLIVDIDVLNDKDVLERIVEEYEVSWDEVNSDYNSIVSNLHSAKEKINKQDVINCINEICSSRKSVYLTKKEIDMISQSLRTVSKWEVIKKGGKSALPAGDCFEAYNRLDAILKRKGVYIVPVGELERFIKEVGNHGPEWVNNVFEKYTNLNHKVYEEIKIFMKEVCP